MRTISLGLTTEECTYQDNKPLDDANAKTVIKKLKKAYDAVILK